MASLFGWHIAHLEQADDVPDAQTLNQLLHALAHGFRTAGDDVAELDQLLPRQGRRVAEIGAAQLVQKSGLDRLDGAVAGRVCKAGIDVQAAVEEVADVRAVEPLRLGVGLGDANALREGGAVR